MYTKLVNRHRRSLFSKWAWNWVGAVAALALTACGTIEVGWLAQTAAPDPTATVPATEAAAGETPTAAPTAPVSTHGTLTGRVCYPSEFIPAMTAYFQNVGTAAITELPIEENQQAYTIELEPGTYTAYTWREDYEFGQGVSVMVDTGDGIQQAARLRPLELPAGATVTADLCDPLPDDVRPSGAASTPPSPAGLVYGSTGGLSLMDADGTVTPVFDRSEAVLSPDGRQALYVSDDDLWLADLGSGERTNLTNTPERVEHAPMWWPARPDIVLFSSYAQDREILMGPGIFPSLVRTDGSGYTILYEDSDVYSMAPSPDGVTLAYGIGPIGWLHNVDSGQRVVFDPTRQGVDLTGRPRVPANWSIGGPAWDPTGRRRIAWTLGLFYEDGTNEISTGVFDLDTGTATLIHPYAMAGTDGFPPAARWSPDGQWLATSVWSLDPNEQGLWVARPDGSRERYLGQGGGPTWHPDGRWLAWTDALNSTLASRPASTDLFVLPRQADHWLLEWRRAP